MKELTREQKIKAIDDNIKRLSVVKSGKSRSAFNLTSASIFLCTNLERYLAAQNLLGGLDISIFDIKEHQMLELFPEFHELIMTVGKKLDYTYCWGYAWSSYSEGCEVQFKIDKLTELRNKLKEKKHG